MQKLLWEGNTTHRLYIGDPDYRPYECTLIGTIEVTPPKKTVVKEAGLTGCGRRWEFIVPPDAKNVKCTYEIEE